VTAEDNSIAANQ